VEHANSLERAGSHDISFIASPHHLAALAATKAGAVILSPADAARFAGNALVVNNPPLAFARVCAHLHPVPRPAAGVHASAVVDPSAQIAPTAIVGAAAVVGAGAVVAAEAWIGAGCVVGERAQIGERTRLVANVVVQDDCVVGRDCLLQPGAVLGA